MQVQNKYKEAGVDIDAGDELVERLKKLCPEIGGFGGLYPLGDSYLVAGTDGVGTKLKLAFEKEIHDTVGIDLVAMCVNDVITTGAKPLFFLDYFATSKLDVDLAEKVIGGIIRGCEEAGCILLGGETAEMPGFYKAGEYDISGFCVGIVKKEHLIDGTSIVVGDKIVGIPSSGLHSNGFSLVRKILENATPPSEWNFLTPTLIYAKMLQKIQNSLRVKGVAHITGGGLTENVPRMLSKGLAVMIDKKAWCVPPIFRWIQEKGGVSESEMYRTFNMGIGLAIALTETEAKKLMISPLDCTIIGEVVTGEGVIYV